MGDDEDIEIDFSNIFKKKKKEAKDGKEEKKKVIKSREEEEDKTQNKDYETSGKSIDDKKDIKEEKENIKNQEVIEKEEKYHKIIPKHNIKKKKEMTEKHHQKKVEDKIEVDFSGFSNFLRKSWIVLLILIPIFFAIFFRMYPAYLPITDTWAKNNVDNYLMNIAKEQVNQQYPSLPEANKQTLVKNTFEEIKKDMGTQYEEQMKIVSSQIKDRLQNDKGETYLFANDPYHYYRKTLNIVEKGHYWDEKKDGVPWDNHMLAPIGAPMEIEFHTIAGYITYKIMHLFNPERTVMGAFFFLPVIFSALAVIPAFFLGKRLAGWFGGLVSGLIVAMHPTFLARTVGGHSDTDTYNILFPLIIVWLLVEGLYSKEWKNKVVLFGLAGFFMGFYSFAWSAWWHLFIIIIAALLLIIIIELIKALKNKSFKKVLHNIYIFLIFGISSYVFVSIFMKSFSVFFRNVLISPIKSMAIKEAAKANLWPNVYTTVAELNPTSFKGVVNSMLGSTYFWLSLLALIVFLFLTIYWEKKYKDKFIDYRIAIIMLLWFILDVAITLKAGTRFSLLLVPAFAIGFGVGCGLVLKYFTKYGEKWFSIPKTINAIVVIAIVLLIFMLPVVKSAKNIAKNNVPDFDDAWYYTLNNIKEKSQPNAIINSWWDWGHWFKAIADRPTTFDGASQNTPQAHWIGKVLRTENETEAIGILRMLDCGANRAFEVLFNQTNDTAISVDRIGHLVMLDRDKAEKFVVDNNLDTKVLDYTHCENPPENYFIVSEDMVAKAGVWAHFGGWDFRRAAVYRKVKNLDVKSGIELIKNIYENEIDDKRAEQLYYEVIGLRSDSEANTWISSWPGYQGGEVVCNFDNKTISCANGAVIDYKTLNLVTDSQNIPYSIVLMENGKIKENKLNNSNLPISVVVYKIKDSYRSFVSSPELAKSMFSRLFFMNGEGLKHFEQFSHDRSITTGDIYVYKIKWN